MQRYHLPLAAAAVVLFALPAAAQTCEGTRTANSVRLNAEATNLRNANGEVAFTVYPNDPKRFLASGGKLLRVRAKATGPTTRACFWLPPGQYAMVLYHDENGDRKFNRTLWTPKEGFAFSNDAPTSIGLPKLADARFTLPANGASLRMRMRYRP